MPAAAPFSSAHLAPEPLDAFLPTTKTTIFAKRAMIYELGAERLYWVVEGRVLVYRQLANGPRINLGLFTTGALFGETALSEPRPLDEVAQALESTTLMSYTPDQFRVLLATRPGMWSAFANDVLLPRQADLARRLAEFRYGIGRHLALSLLRIAEQLGASPLDSGFTLPAMSHELLAAEIGTSRELVTTHALKLRKRGVIGYDRKHIYLDVAQLRAVANGEAA